MKIELENKNIEINYNDDGVLKNVLDLSNGENMMVEYTQVGSGYDFTSHNGYVKMDMCNAIYVRIMKLDIFIPKFLFINNQL